MKSAPRTIDHARVVCFTPIDERHRHTAKSRQIVAGALQGPAAGLAICQYEGEAACYLFGCDDQWNVISDTVHLTLAEAKVQAEFEYEGVSSTWELPADVVSETEWRISELLHVMLTNLQVGASIVECVGYQDFLRGLEHFLVDVLRERHPDWRNGSLDGILPLVARKTAAREAEILGQCILISDQTLAPIHVLLQTGQSGNSITWLELKLGELGPRGMIRTPYESQSVKRALGLADEKKPKMTWAYHVTFGDRAE